MGTTAQKLQAVANSKAAIKAAIEAKGVSNVGDVLSQYATKIGQISGGGSSGDPRYEANGQGQLVKKNFALNYFNDVTSIPDYGLDSAYYKSNVTSVSFPNLTSVGYHGLRESFNGCTSLTTVDLSSLTSVGTYGLRNTFDGCTSLTTVDLSKVTSVVNYGLYYAFNGCTSLTTVDLSSLTSVGQNGMESAFAECTSLTHVYLSKLSSVLSWGLLSTFYGCTSLTHVYLSKLSSVLSWGLLSTFYGCTHLELVDFSKATAVPALSSTSTFGNTNNYYRIVVPNALYNQWIAATNWSDPSIVTHIEKAIKAIMFTAESANSTISLDAVGNPPSLDIEYSTDGGTTFSTYTVGTTVTLANVGDTVMFKAGDTGNTSLATDSSNYHKFTMTGSISLEDDVSYLLSRSGVPSTTALADYAFYGLFNGCSALQNAPELPWTTMGEGCYGEMFKGCTSLTSAPELHATTLATGCYNEMFYGCSSLNYIPLYYKGNFSTTYFNDWVDGVAATGTLMYDGTDTTTGTSAIPTGWTVVGIPRPELCFTAREANSTVKMQSSSGPTVNLEYSTDKSTWNPFVVGTTTVTLANIGDRMWLRAVSTNEKMASGYNTNYNYFVMTGQIEASGNINSLLDKEPDLVTTCPQQAYPHLFDGCSALVDAQNLKLASTTASQNCYGHKMFYNCTNLVHGPEIMATNLLTLNYTAEYMFQGCSSLQSVKIHATGNTWNGSATVSWMDGVSSTGTFYYNGTYTGRGASYIPTGWTITPFST